MFKGLSLLAATELGGVVSRHLRAVPYYLSGGLIFLFGFGFLLDFAHTWLSLRMGPLAASGVLAAILLTLAGVFLLVGHFVKDRRQARPSAVTASALIAAPLAARLLGGKLRVGTVALAGMVAIGALLGRQAGRQAGRS